MNKNQTPEEREAYYDGAVKRARDAGMDYAYRAYDEFGAAFVECTVCGWIDYVGKPGDLERDPRAQKRLYNHSMREHRA